MTDDAGWQQRLIDRIDELHRTDPQFRAATPSTEVTEAAHRAGLRLWDVIDTYLTGYADRPALGQRARELSRDEATGATTTTLLSGFDTITYRQLRDRVAALADVWHDRLPDLRPGDMVAVLGFTSIGYAVATLACARLGAVFVPLQTSSTAEQLAPIIAETTPRVLATSLESLDVAVDVVADAPSIERLVVFDYNSGDDDQRERYEAVTARLSGTGRAVTVTPMAEELEAGPTGAEPPADAAPAGEDPLAMLIYTSGSTGAPKGAMFSADMMTRIWRRPRGPSMDLGRQLPAIHLQYMPLSHIYGLEWLIATLALGGTGYFTARSDMSTLFDDIALVRPTALNLVPRVCDMIYRRYRAELDGRPAGGRSPDERAEEVKAELREDFLGGRVISAMCGSAPLSKTVHEFMESMLGIIVADGYGSTETGGGILRNNIVKRPPVTDYKLVDVPELDYYTTDKPHPRGELYVKSTELISGYYQHPELTEQIFDDDGYYKTGDIMAETGPDTLVYLDRSNNVIKLSQGEFVAVSKLEAAYNTSVYVRQIFLYGSSEQPFLLAVIVPDTDAVAASDSDDAHSLIGQSLQHIATDAGFHAYEVPRDFIVEPEPFTRDNGLLSGVGKLLRPALAARYGQRLEEMYGEINAGQHDQLDRLRAEAGDVATVDTVARAAAATLGLSSAEGMDPETKFIELGGDSLSAMSFATLLGGIFSVDVPVQTIVSPTATLAGIAAYLDGERGSASSRPTFASVHGRGATEAHAGELALDKFIDDATLAAAPQLSPQEPGTVETVLLTGANGYLGRFLCLEWLQRLAPRGGKLICIIRGADPGAARQRIEAAIDSGDDELSQRFRELADNHLEVLAGDLAAANLGLDTPTWQRLAGSVDLVVHAAAMVNHVLPYGQLFGPNVIGTAEVIKLAISTRLKPVNFLSTVAVTALPDGGFLGEDVDVREASPSRSLRDSYASGYANSKWAGEVLLANAHQLCRLPVTVFRSDMILAHSHYAGQVNVTDMFTRLVVSLLATGLAPRSFYRLGPDGRRQRAHYDGLPADFTAEAVTTLGEGSAGHRTYNVLNTHDDGISQDTFVDWLIAAGQPIDRIDDYQDWLSRFTAAMKALPEAQRRNSLLPLLGAYTRPAESGMHAPAHRFRAAVQDARIGEHNDVPHLTEALVTKYITDLRQLGLLDDASGTHVA